MKDKFPSVSVITVNYNGKGLLKDYFDSVMSLDYPIERLEFIMVDNGSGDGSVSFVRNNYPGVKLIQCQVNNYCVANNLAIRQSKADIVALLNNDVRVTKTWLVSLVEAIQSDSRISTAGGKVLFRTAAYRAPAMWNSLIFM